MNNKYKLVIFYDDFELKDNDIICLPRNEFNFRIVSNKAKLFVTFENLDYTYFNIVTAMKNNCLCAIPKYYKDLQNKCISFDQLDMNILKQIIETIKNKKKIEITQTIYQKYIVQHLNTNKWLKL